MRGKGVVGNSMDEGYCVREFSRFLKKEDPDDLWCRLRAMNFSHARVAVRKGS
jgi:hypothetical protein